MSLGDIAPFAKLMRRIVIDTRCQHDTTYAVDLFGGVSKLESWVELDKEGEETKKTCRCKEANRVMAQGVVDRFLATRRPGEGWSESGLREVISCFY